MSSLAAPSVSSAAAASDEVARLALARWLGYLTVERPRDPVVDAYLGDCLENTQPAVVLCRRGRRGATVIFQVPIGARVLKADAVERLRHHAVLLHGSRCRRRPIITSVGGELTGLPSDGAEELAFRIADAARDPDQTEPGRQLQATGDT